MNLLNRIKRLWKLSEDDVCFCVACREDREINFENKVETTKNSNKTKKAQIIKRKKVDPIEEILKQENE